MIDRIRHDIQERLDQLLAEVEKLRSALAALDPRERSSTSRANGSTAPAAKAPSRKPSAAKATSPRAAPRASSNGSSAGTTKRTPSGATKAKVLGALSSNEALTAGEIAKATGLGRASVSTTLSKLAKTGEATKAKRGYRLP